jgi:hypothetical protein
MFCQGISTVRFMAKECHEKMGDAVTEFLEVLRIQSLIAELLNIYKKQSNFVCLS